MHHATPTTAVDNVWPPGGPTYQVNRGGSHSIFSGGQDKYVLYYIRERKTERELELEKDREIEKEIGEREMERERDGERERYGESDRERVKERKIER